MSDRDGFDYDWLVIGSGFGGSVSALRLAEKGYSVAVLECGRRFRDEDFAETTWDCRRYYWMPQLGMRGILRLTLFKDVFVASGCGVGGGSPRLRQHAVPRAPGVLRRPADGRAGGLGARARAALRRGRADARRHDLRPGHAGRPAAQGVRASRLGVGDTYAKPRASACSWARRARRCPTRTSAARARSAPAACAAAAAWSAAATAPRTRWSRTTCSSRRSTGVADPARAHGDRRQPARREPTGRDGYEVTHERSGAWVRRGREQLHRARRRRRRRRPGHQPAAVSVQAARLAAAASRTGSATWCAPTASRSSPSRRRTTRATSPSGVAITSSIYPDPDTHIEAGHLRQGRRLAVAAVRADDRGRRARHPAAAPAAERAAPPAHALRALRVRAWSRRTMILLVMQSLDNSMRLKVEAPLAERQRGADHRAGRREPQPRQDPRRLRAPPSGSPQRIGGTPQAIFTEAILSIPMTAHILGGAVIGSDRDTGVVDDAPARLRLREPARLRRRRDPRERRRQPEPDDHRARRAGDDADPREARGDSRGNGWNSRDLAPRHRATRRDTRPNTMRATRAGCGPHRPDLRGAGER